MNRLYKWFSKSKIILSPFRKGKAVEFDSKKLLRDRRVVEEINRHKWLESEIAGYDVGFEKATEDWIANYAQAWLSYHDPQLKHFGKSPTTKNVKAK